MPCRPAAPGSTPPRPARPGSSADSSGPRKKSAAAIRACRRGRGDLDVPSEQRQHRRHLARGVGVGEASRPWCRGCGSSGGRRAAAPGAAGGGPRGRPRRAPARRAGPARRRARRRRHRDVAEAGHAVDVDQVGRRGQPHVRIGIRLWPPASTLPSGRPRRGRRRPPRRCAGRGRRTERASPCDPAFRVRGSARRPSGGAERATPGGAVGRRVLSAAVRRRGRLRCRPVVRSAVDGGPVRCDRRPCAASRR